jgi:hypothetical protein
MSAPNDAHAISNTPFTGGQKALTIALAAAAIGLVLWLVAIFTHDGTTRAMFSWLWAYFYWLTPVVGAMGWLCAFNAAKAKWIVLPRRLLEMQAGTAWVFVLLFIPVIVTMKTIYPWMHPETYEDELTKRLFEHRHVWMNHTFFLVRTAIYLFIFVGVSERLLRWSLGQDEGKNPLNTLKAWKLSPGAMPFLGFCISFAAFDWLMSLNVTFYSSMFGLYVIAGSVMAAMAVWILTNIALKTPISGNHMHSMGKLMFAFNCFWAYTAFSQFMLIWIANIPDETPWHRMRLWSNWSWIGWFLVVFHFALPFIILLSKRIKFSKFGLSFMAVWLLIAHAVDHYWIVLPQLTPDGPKPSLSDLGAFVGIGSIVLAAFLLRLRGKKLVPVGDPFLPTSLEYHP